MSNHYVVYLKLMLRVNDISKNNNKVNEHFLLLGQLNWEPGKYCNLAGEDREFLRSQIPFPHIFPTPLTS